MQTEPTRTATQDNGGRLPARVLVSEAGNGHLDLTIRDRCARLPVQHAMNVRRTLAGALERSGAPGLGSVRCWVPVAGARPERYLFIPLPKLPEHLLVGLGEDGTATLDDYDGKPRAVAPVDGVNLRQALSLAVAWCTAPSERTRGDTP